MPSAIGDSNSNREPRVSVLMAVYNGQRYLKAAVESILAQSFEDFEFIIVDDGSTDRSPALLKRYADRDARIRLVSIPHAGLTRSLNQGLALARGELVGAWTPTMSPGRSGLPGRSRSSMRIPISSWSDARTS